MTARHRTRTLPSLRHRDLTYRPRHCDGTGCPHDHPVAAVGVTVPPSLAGVDEES